MKVYQTYIGRTSARIGGLNQRSQLSRRGGSSMEPKEEGRPHQLSFQKASISSSMTNQNKKQQGIADHRGDFQLTTTINQPATTKTPSANMFIHGLVLSSTNVSKAGKNLRGQTSCQRIDSSLNYPASGFQQFGDVSVRKSTASQDGTKLGVYANLKFNRQSNTSLGVGPNSNAGLIIGNNTVKILKPNLSQQKIGNSLNKASSFENQYATKNGVAAAAVAPSGKASVQKASGIKIKGQDITRVDFSANLLQQSQLTTKQSKKVPYPPPPPKINATAAITNSQLTQLHQHQQPQLIAASESREKGEAGQATG